MYVAISPAETLRKTTKKPEKSKNNRRFKTRVYCIRRGDIEFGDEILPSVTQYVTVKKEPKKIPIQTRKSLLNV